MKSKFYTQKGGEFKLVKCTCNKCGKDFDIWDASEYFHIHQKLGFGTKFDGAKLKLHLCCSCMEEIIDSCIISPVKENT